MAELKSVTLPYLGSEDFNAAGVGNTTYQWTVNGSAAVNTVTMNAYGGTVYGNAGADIVTAAGLATIYGGVGNDSVKVTTGTNNIVYGDAGADILSLAGGSVAFYGGADADKIYIDGAGTNTIYGDAGADEISVVAGTSSNVIYGGADNDKISLAVDTTATTLSGGAGNDTIAVTSTVGGTAVSTILFGAGDGKDSIVTGFDFAEDKISYGFTASALAGATITYNGGADTTIDVAGTNSDVLTFETGFADEDALATATQGTAAGLFKSSEGKNVIYASNGVTNLKADAADAYVIGAEVNSNFTYNATALKYFGKSTASANDLISASTEASAVTLDLTDAKFSSIEMATGGSGADILRGLTSAADTLTGGAGADSLWGRGGADKLTGDAGDDVFYAGIGDGADVVADATGGANGQDTIKLYNVAKSDITISTDVPATATILTFTGGDSVTLTGGEGAAYGTKAAKYALSDGTVMRVGAQTAGNMVYDSTVGYYWGSKSSVANYGVTAAAQTTGQTINLYDTAKFNNIHVAIGSATAANTLRGTSGKDTLQGGSAADAFWGGASGTDTMILGVDNAMDTVWFGKTDGVDEVQNADASDKVKLWNVALSDIAGFSSATGDLVMTFKNNAVDQLTLKGGIAPTFELQDGTTFAVSTDGVYSSTAAFYAGAATTVTAATQTAGVLLDLGDTVKYAVNYANVTGGSGADTLRGSSAGAQTLTGGSGNDLLWGAGGNGDIMTGGAGVDTFYWGTTDGNDEITDGVAGESVLLYTTGLTSAGLKAELSVAGAMVITAAISGATLTIDNFNASSLNKFVFGYSSTADNTYSIVADTASATGYSFQKITA